MLCLPLPTPRSFHLLSTVAIVPLKHRVLIAMVINEWHVIRDFLVYKTIN